MPGKAHLARFALVSVVAGLLAMPAFAGTRMDPEVADAPRDTVDTNTGIPLTAPAADILSAWFVEASPSEFEVHVRVADLTAPAIGQSHLWRVRWTTGAEVMFVDAERFFDGERGNFGVRDGFGTGYPSTSDGSLVLIFDDAADEIVAIVPRSFMVALTGGGTRAFDFGSGTVFASPEVLAFQGQGSLGGITVNNQLDDAGPGRDFTLGASTVPNPQIFSGVRPFQPITTTYAKLDGVLTAKGGGIGAFDTIQFEIGNNPKSLTFNGVSIVLAQGDLVVIHDFEGDYRVTDGHVKFAGTAASFTKS